MFKVNITEFRNHLPQYLSDVANGNEILVTSHGRGIARIFPPVDLQQDAKNKLKELQKICKISDNFACL